MSNLTTKAGLPRKRVAAGAPPAERILLHTDRSGDCWLWTAAVDAGGYGRVQVDGRLLRSHRVAYETFVGAIPDGLHIDHLCRVRACCNPFHLEAVTPQENVRRGESVGAKALRRDVCLYGHAYDEHGVVRCGRRVCKLCQNAYMRLYKRVPYAEAMRRKREGIPVVDLAAHFFAERSHEVAA